MTLPDRNAWANHDARPLLGRLNGTAATAAAPPGIPIPSSQRPIGIGNWESADEGLISAWRYAEPKPRGWAWDRLAPAGGVVTIVYGDSGIYKSWIGLALLLSKAGGRDFLGRAAPACPAVWLDVEMDRDEFLRRAYAVARGLGLPDIPPDVYYYRLPAALSDQRVLDRVREHLRATGAGFYVLDSLTVALLGGDAKEANEIVPALKGMERWGVPGLAIDHIRNPQAGVPQSGLNPFGSVFKKHAARSMLQVVKAPGGGVVLTHKKSSFGPEGDVLYAAVRFVPDPHVPGRLASVVVEQVDPGDDAMAGIEDELPQLERVFREVAGNSGAGRLGATPEAIGEALEMKPKTASNYLSVLKRAGRVINVGGRWFVAATTHEGGRP